MNWEIKMGSWKHLKNGISDCRVRLCPSVSIAAIARQKSEVAELPSFSNKFKSLGFVQALALSCTRPCHAQLPFIHDCPHVESTTNCHQNPKSSSAFA